MKPLNKNAKKVLDILAAGLEVGEAKKVGDGKGFMAVHVDRFAKDHYAVAHRYVQNGDSMADPDMVFWRDPDGDWQPVSFQQDSLGLYQEAMTFDENGHPNGVRRRLHRDLVSFANGWMQNIECQQKLKGAA